MGNDISREFRIEVAKWINTVRDRQRGKGVFDEEDVKGAIIDPLLRILGWDVNDPREVKKEARIEGKRADYALKIDDDIKVIIEAKAFSISLDGSDSRGSYEKQAINYAYNQGIDWAILTNGETWRLYNAYWRTSSKLAFEINIGDFPKEIEKIVLLTKDNVSGGRLEEYFRGRVKRPHVDEEVTQVLLNARAALTESIIKLNEGFTTDELRGGIQRMLDRLLFMKICEDRDIRKFGQLRSLVAMVESDPRDKTTLTYYLTTAFKQFRDVYDGELFDENVVDRLKVDNKTLMDIIETLYVYDFSTINVDVLGRIYEDYLSNVLSKLEEGGLEWITDNRERKEHGQFYTPQYIVDYIVDSVGITKESRILDPACGSGAFLIKAYDRVKERYLEDEERQRGNRNNNNLLAYIPKEEITEMNKRILTENLYGVDLNPEAVELTKINLWLRSIQKDTELNKLDNNIQCGNSLVDDPEVAGERAFNWEEEFLNVLDDGGFDVVIGNPPYVNLANISNADERRYYQKKYETAQNKSDLYAFFMERVTKNLIKDGSYFSFIVSRTWTNLKSFSNLRKLILDNFEVKKLVPLSLDTFREASVEPVIFVLKKQSDRERRLKNVINVERYVNNKFVLSKKIPQKVFAKDKNHIFNLEWTPEIEIIFLKLRENVEELGNLIEFMRGTKTSDNERFLSRDKKDNDYKKVLRGRDIHRYNIDYDNLFIWYRPDEMKKKNGSVPQNPKLYEVAEKIILQGRSGNRIIATLDTDHHYCIDTTYISKIKNLDKYSLKYVLALLNSKLINFWYGLQFKTSTISGYELDRIPIRCATSK
ncbi:MAG: N-6 DNA methylase, partial [Candidatus Altiarchaeales archaeon]|nr:N-6 DNA methylase [Candidatus Altiarchaeales archaeon]